MSGGVVPRKASGGVEISAHLRVLYTSTLFRARFSALRADSLPPGHSVPLFLGNLVTAPLPNIDEPVTLDLQSGVGSGVEEESIMRMIWLIFGTLAWIGVFFASVAPPAQSQTTPNPAKVANLKMALRDLYGRPHVLGKISRARD